MSKKASSSRQHQSGKANRWILYGPLALGIILFAGYSIAWNYGAGIMRTEVDRFISEQRQAGMTAEHGEIRVGGYPFLLRAELPSPAYGDPASGWLWQADSLFVDTLPLSPTRLILSPTGNQTITVKDGNGEMVWSVKAEMTKASLSQTETGIELRGLTATPLSSVRDLPVSEVKIGLFRSNTRLDDSEDGTLENDTGGLGIEAQKIIVTQPGQPPVTITYFDTSLTLTALQALQNPGFAASELEAWRAADGSLTIEDMRLILDDETGKPPTQMRMNGKLSVDERYYPAGEISTSLKDPGIALALLERVDAITPDERQQVDEMLGTMSSQTQGELKALFTLSGGFLKTGPIRIADLPRLQ